MQGFVRQHDWDVVLHLVSQTAGFGTAHEAVTIDHQLGLASGADEQLRIGLKVDGHGGLRKSKPAAADVVERAELIADLDVVEQSAQAANGNTQSVRATEAAELAAPFQVRFDFQEEAGGSE